MLRSQLQEGKSLPKFEPRSRVGKFLGHSSQHYDNVALVLNPKTDHISPQYHILFDDKFETIKSGTTPNSWQVWESLASQDFISPKPPITFEFPDFEQSPMISPPLHLNPTSKSYDKQREQSSTQRETAKTYLPSPHKDPAINEPAVQPSSIDLRTLVSQPRVSNHTRKRKNNKSYCKKQSKW